MFRPFEKFCRNHFVNNQGELQKVKSRDERVSKREMRIKIQEIFDELNPLQEKVASLYKLAATFKQKDEAKSAELYREAGVIQRKIKQLRKKLRRFRSQNDSRLKKDRQRAD